MGFPETHEMGLHEVPGPAVQPTVSALNALYHANGLGPALFLLTSSLMCP